MLAPLDISTFCTSGVALNDESDMSEGMFTRKMLYVSSFFLRALEARGCLREEDTSGALVKFYAKHLHNRLREIASSVGKTKGNEKKSTGSPFRKRGLAKDGNPEDKNTIAELDELGGGSGVCNTIPDYSSKSNSQSSSDNQDSIVDPDPDYDWSDPRDIRHELAQCYECLHRIPELETVSGHTTVLDEER